MKGDFVDDMPIIFDAYLDGELSEQDAEIFNIWLFADQDNFDKFFWHLQMDYYLQKLMRGEDNDDLKEIMSL